LAKLEGQRQSDEQKENPSWRRLAYLRVLTCDPVSALLLFVFLTSVYTVRNGAIEDWPWRSYAAALLCAALCCPDLDLLVFGEAQCHARG
jgi:hypothetical protein